MDDREVCSRLESVLTHFESEKNVIAITVASLPCSNEYFLSTVHSKHDGNTRACSFCTDILCSTYSLHKEKCKANNLHVLTHHYCC